MLDRRSLILGLAASLMLPAIDAFAAPKGGSSKSNKGGNGGGNNGGGNNGGGNNGGGNNGGGNNGGNNGGGNTGNNAGGGNTGNAAGKAGGAAKETPNGNANSTANGNPNGAVNGNANANSGMSGSQAAVDDALKAVESGKAIPLRDIQSMIEPQYPGVLIEAQLQRRGAVFFYDLKMLSPQGRVYVVTVEAATGLVAGR
jgi:uncharacterized membrane protein YkoI